MKKLLILADGLHLQDGVHLKLGKIFSLAVFLMVLFASSGQQAKSEDGVIWTKDFSPYKLLNAVFSPDDQFIYATCTDIYYVIKYDLQGNILDTIKNVGGIRQFSEDGKYFWNYNGDKYDANTFEKLYSFGGGGKHSLKSWSWEINETTDIGIATSIDYHFIDEQYGRYYDSTLIIFKPSTAELVKWTSVYDKKFLMLATAINIEGTKAAILMESTPKDGKGNLYTDKICIEIWNLPSLEKEREINLPVPTSNLPFILRYSPDGSVLGYQHDGKLTLYSTTDYSVVWESEEIGVDNFAWSNDSKYLLYSFVKGQIYGIKKYSFPNYKEIFFYQAGVGEPVFINFNSTNNMILTTRTNRLMYLLDNTLTSVSDPFITNYYKTNVNQDATNNILTLTINATNSVPAIYSITDTLGKTYTKQNNLNLEQGLNQFDIDISNLPSGNYFLQLTIAGHSQTIKFIVVR